MIRWTFLLCLLPVLAFAAPFDPGKAGFSLSYKEETSPYRSNAVFLMPGEVLEVKVHGVRHGNFSFRNQAGDSLGGGPEWNWTAPMEPGLYPLRVIREASEDPSSQPPGADDTVLLNAFVMTPATAMKGEYLEKYRIGAYPKRPLKGLRFYRNPTGYIKVDSLTAQAQVSPHFTLGQFICKQGGGSLPAYVVLRERLVLKLEAVLEEVNKEGHSAQTFHVMSGYRTPFYNRSLGNVKHSAHQFGGAADVFIDSDPVDGNMDDLNGDGRSDGKDSAILFNIVDKMSLNQYYLPYLGGIGSYNRNDAHGPFVHVDVRGFRAIW